MLIHVRTVVSLAAVAMLAAPVSSSTDGLTEPADAVSGDLKPGEVVTVAGTGETGVGEDGPDARESVLGERLYVEVAPDGTVYVTDLLNGQVHDVRGDGSIGTVVRTEDLRTDEDSDGAGSVPTATAVAPDGTVYVGASNGIHRLDADGEPTVVVPATPLDTGDEAPAGEWLGRPHDLAVDADGAVVVADYDRGRILRVDPDGAITTLAGGGDVALPDSDGGAATDAVLVRPRSVDVDSAGAVYFVQTLSDSEDDQFHPVVRRVDPDGTISTVAGLNDVGDSGDGGPASEAQLGDYLQVAIDADDTLLIADRMNRRVRAVAADGTITTSGTVNGRSSAPTAPYDVAAGVNGDLFVTDVAQVLRMDAGGGPLVGECAVAATGDADDPWAGEESGAVVTFDDAGLEQPMSVAVDADGRLLALDAATGAVMVVGTEGPAVAVDPPGRVLTDTATAMLPTADGAHLVASDERILKVYPDGTEVLVAGGGSSTEPADGHAAIGMRLSAADLACDGGTIVVADADSGGVYRLSPDGKASPVAEHVLDTGGYDIRNGIAAHEGTVYAVVTSGDAPPDGRGVVAIDGDGERRVIAGGQEAADREGDGGPATDAALTSMGQSRDVAVDADGTVYVSTGTGIRRIDPDGVIDTVPAGDDGDAVSPTAAGLAVDAHGNLYFADPDNGQVGVVVRPGEMTDPFPWVPVVAGGAAVLVLAGAAVVWRRRRRTVPDTTAHEEMSR